MICSVDLEDAKTMPHTYQLGTWALCTSLFSQALGSRSTPGFLGSKFQEKNQKGSLTELSSQMLQYTEVSLQRQIPKFDF